MSRDLNINVNVNPNGVASPTQTRVTASPQVNEIDNRSKGNAVSAAAIISVAQRGVSIGISNIGELTGNKSLQRNAQFAANLATLGIAGFVNPAAAVSLAVFQLGQTAISATITNRNLNIQRDYNRQVRQAVHNNSRR
jgi:hypothetical protein